MKNAIKNTIIGFIILWIIYGLIIVAIPYNGKNPDIKMVFELIRFSTSFIGTAIIMTKIQIVHELR